MYGLKKVPVTSQAPRSRFSRAHIGCVMRCGVAQGGGHCVVEIDTALHRDTTHDASCVNPASSDFTTLFSTQNDVMVPEL